MTNSYDLSSILREISLIFIFASINLRGVVNMIRFLIVTLLTLTTFVRGQETDIDNCGIAAAPSGLVFGGKVSEAYKWPWLAALYYTESESFFCGGTLLSSKLVSTVKSS